MDVLSIVDLASPLFSRCSMWCIDLCVRRKQVKSCHIQTFVNEIDLSASYHIVIASSCVIVVSWCDKEVIVHLVTTWCQCRNVWQTLWCRHHVADRRPEIQVFDGRRMLDPEVAIFLVYCNGMLEAEKKLSAIEIQLYKQVALEFQGWTDSVIGLRLLSQPTVSG